MRDRAYTKRWGPVKKLAGKTGREIISATHVFVFEMGRFASAQLYPSAAAVNALRISPRRAGQCSELWQFYPLAFCATPGGILLADALLPKLAVSFG